MKIKNPLRRLTRFEAALWAVSSFVVCLSFFISPQRDIVNFIASLVGVTALIFIAKGMVIGQALIVVFAVLYGIVSYRQAYYGEMITYLGMSAPAALLSCISWIKNPYGNTDEVKIGRLDKKKIAFMVCITVSLTVAFYFILDALGTASLIVSTVSVATSVLASYMTFIRVPYYALGYVLNDIVLIVLWAGSAAEDISYLPVVFCFVMFLLNDLYGFFAWQKRKKKQADE